MEFFLKLHVTALYSAIKFGHIEIIKLLCADNRLEINLLNIFFKLFIKFINQ